MKKKYPAQLKQFGEKIKELREKANLSQDALGESTGLDRRSIQRIEGGEFAASLQAIFAISLALKVPVAELVNHIEFSFRKKKRNNENDE